MFRRNVTIVNIRTRKKKTYINDGNESFRDSLLEYIGQTIIIYTVGGGININKLCIPYKDISQENLSGIIGVLLEVGRDQIKLITELESPPSLHSNNENIESEAVNVSLGSIANIPINKIAVFVHSIV